MRFLKFSLRCAISVTLLYIALGHAAIQLNYDSFSITIPDGWIEIPKEILDSGRHQLLQITPDADVPQYYCGFQLENAYNWLDYPYILVDIKKTGRIPKNEFRKFEQYKVQKDLDKIQKNLSPIMSDLNYGQMYYEEKSNVIWSRGEVNLHETEKVCILSALIPTEEGFVGVSGFCRKIQSDQLEQIFQSVVLSIIPNQKLAYQPKWADNLPAFLMNLDWAKILGVTIVALIIAAISAMFSSYNKRKRMQSF